LRDVQLRRTQTINIHLQGRVVQYLHQMRIGHAGYLAHTLQQLPSQAGRAVEVDILYLHVDWRRQAEIQHLADNVRGLEIKDAAGELFG